MSDEMQISYMALEVGTPVHTVAGESFGTVAHVLQIPEFDLFDGIVVHTEQGLRFVDRDQIELITRTVVHSRLTMEQAASLPPPEGPPVYHVDALQDVGPSLTAHLGRIFRREHWIQDR